MGLVNWLKQLNEDAKEACRVRSEGEESVNCPYCKEHYPSTEINEKEQTTGVENITAMKCSQCENIFGIKRKTYHEPCYASWRVSVPSPS